MKANTDLQENVSGEGTQLLEMEVVAARLLGLWTIAP